MLDEHIRIQESYDMSIDTVREEGLEEGIAQGKRQMVG